MDRKQREELWMDSYTSDRRAVYSVIRDTLKRAVPWDDLDDLIHDAYTNAWEKLDSFDEDKSKFLTWLCNVAKSTTVDYIKQESAGKRPDIVYESTLTPEEEVEDILPNPMDDPAEQAQEASTLMAAFKDLPPQMCECVFLRRMGFSNQEIAERLGTTEGSVRSQISQAKKYFS